MYSKIESLKNNIEAGLLTAVRGVGVRGYGDMLLIQFKEIVGDVSRVRVGEFFRYRPGVVVNYSLNVRVSSGSGLIFTWKDSIKPSNFIEIEHEVRGLVG